jgi:hypothetical protein
MRFIFNGNATQDSSYKLFKSADAPLINIRLVDDAGAPVNLTGATATLEVYDRSDRKNAAAASLSLTTVVAAAGAMSWTPTIANTAFGPGTYYAYVKHVVTAGTVVTISKNSIKLVIG